MMPKFSITGCLLAISVALVTSSGCRRAAPALSPVYPATGTVVYKNGGPVVGRISFRPVESGATHRAGGIMGRDGKFSLSTVRPGTAEEPVPGVPAGDYMVTVIPVSANPVPSSGRPDIRLPEHVQIQAGENVFKFELDRKP